MTNGGPKWIAPNQAAALKPNMNWILQKWCWNTFCNTWKWKWPRVSCRFYISFECWRLFGYNCPGACLVLDQCPVHNMATWIHHLLTKVQHMKLMRSSFGRCVWLEKEWYWASVAPCLGLTCAGWCQRIFYANQAQSSSCIVWMESWHWMNDWETKGLLEKPKCCPALTYQLMCMQLGVMPVSSQIVRESLR